MIAWAGVEKPDGVETLRLGTCARVNRHSGELPESHVSAEHRGCREG